jgi:NAD-dependent SIR2 family protein deacetylase
MREIENIVILTGAGISAESGLATFRGPDGLWEGHRVEGFCPYASQRRPVAFNPLRIFGLRGTNCPVARNELLVHLGQKDTRLRQE